MKPLVILAEIQTNGELHTLFTNRWLSSEDSCPNSDLNHPNHLVHKALGQGNAHIQNCDKQNSNEFSKQFKWGDKTYFFQFNQFKDTQRCYLLCSGYEIEDNPIEEPTLNKEFLTRLTDTLPDMLWAKDTQGRYLFANQAICDNLLMCTKEEVIGKDDVSFALRERAKYPENLKWHTFGELCFNSDEVVLKNQTPQRFEEFGHIKGKMTYLDVHKAPFYDDNGALIGTVGAGRDITQQKQLENSLDQAANMIDVLMEVSLDSLLIFDESLSCIQINPNFTAITGYDFNDVKGTTINAFFSQASQYLLERLQEKKDSDIHRIDVLTKDKTCIPCMVRMRNLTLFGQEVRVVALVDISELQHSQQQLEKVQRIAHMGNFDWDLSTHNIQASDEVYRIYGLEPQSQPLCFNDLFKYVHKDDRLRVGKYLMHPIRHPESVQPNMELSMTYRIVLPDGQIKYITQNGVFNTDINNKPVSIIATTIDITKQTLNQEQILQQKSELEYQAHYDALTQLPNRTLFTDRLTHLIDSREMSKQKHALLFIDLDHFKQINDSFGHNFGDKVLVQIAERLQSATRKGDTLSRLGGDEFTLLLENIKDERCITRVIDNLIQKMSTPIITHDTSLYITLSIGVSMYPENGTDTENLLKNADSAMYKAKDDGRNTYRFYTEEMTQRAFERLALENNLRTAINEESFEVFYQPQYNGQTNQLLGMEALIRWPNPSLGMVSPGHFIPLAEETGLIVELDRWVMKTALKQMASWYQADLNPGRLSLNLTIKQIQQTDLIQFIESQLQASGFSAHHLELEVTEGQIMNQPEAAIETLNALKKLGLSLSIDDFGTGYSSLSQLKRLPVNKLKIDRSFIMDLPHDEEDAMLTKTIIGLAKNLKLDVIAEGVETEAQKQFVIENGCNNIQGYYYSQPLPSSEMEQLLLSIKQN